MTTMRQELCCWLSVVEMKLMNGIDNGEARLSSKGCELGDSQAE